MSATRRFTVTELRQFDGVQSDKIYIAVLVRPSSSLSPSPPRPPFFKAKSEHLGNGE